MYPFLPMGTAREAVARQFEYGEPTGTEPTATPQPVRREVATAPRRRSNPLRALASYTGGMATRATWSPTR